jgi:hypothetical protein
MLTLRRDTTAWTHLAALTEAKLRARRVVGCSQIYHILT